MDLIDYFDVDENEFDIPEAMKLLSIKQLTFWSYFGVLGMARHVYNSRIYSRWKCGV